jgi:hypothetical protein
MKLNNNITFLTKKTLILQLIMLDGLNSILPIMDGFDWIL